MAFSAYSYAIATRFGTNPLDPLGRPPVAGQFDLLNRDHVRALLEEVLAAFPTKRLFELEPEIIPDFLDNPTPEQATRVHAAIERSFGTLLDNMADGLVLTQKALVRRIVEAAKLSDLSPGLGTQLLVPSVTGLKRLIVDKLANALVVEGQKSPADFLAAYNPLFYQPKPVESPTQPEVGLISLTATGVNSGFVTLSPQSNGVVTLALNYADQLGALAAPDYGLAVRYRLGGTAREGIDYTIQDKVGLPIASIIAGQSSGSISIKITPAALAAGDRYLQLELLSADSGMRVDPSNAVVTIAFGSKALALDTATTGQRTSFNPHELVTATDTSPAILRAPAGGSNVVLRGVNGRADLFVVGDTQSAGIPFIENFHAQDGDRILIVSGGLIANRFANQLSDQNNRKSALAALQKEYGADAIAGLSANALDALIAAEIQQISPLVPFDITQLNTMGGFIFDITGRSPVAMVSDYSAATGDSAWASLSMNPNGKLAFAELLLVSGGSTVQIADRASIGSIVGTLTTTATQNGSLSGPFSYSLLPGFSDNQSFSIEGDRLVVHQTPDFKTQASYQLHVRSTGRDGMSFDSVLLVTVADTPKLPAGLSLSTSSVPENQPVGTSVGTLATSDPGLGEQIIWSLVSGSGSTDNSSFSISGNQLLTSTVLDHEWRGSRSIRVRATNSRGLSAEQIILIQVTDHSDTPFVVKLSKNIVAENLTKGTVVGRLSARGATGRRSYTLVNGEGSADNALFVIRGNRLVTRAAIDQEQSPSLNVRVRATDRTGAFTDRVFTIKVRDVKERPAIVIPELFTIDQSGPLKLIFSDTPFAVDNALPSLRLAVTIRVRQGSLSAVSAGGVQVTGTPTVRRFFGSLSALNAYFTDQAGHVIYSPSIYNKGETPLIVGFTELSNKGNMTSIARSVIKAKPFAAQAAISAASTVQHDRSLAQKALFMANQVEISMSHLTDRSASNLYETSTSTGMANRSADAPISDKIAAFVPGSLASLARHRRFVKSMKTM